VEETVLLRPHKPQVDYWDTRCPEKRKNRVYYEAPKTENGCNSDGGIEEIVSVVGSGKGKMAQDEQTVIFSKGSGNVSVVS
jgi:ribosomal protein S27E